VLYVSSLSNVKVVSRAGADPWSLPNTTVDRVVSVYRANGLTQRVRVQGVRHTAEPNRARCASRCPSVNSLHRDGSNVPTSLLRRVIPNPVHQHWPWRRGRGRSAQSAADSHIQNQENWLVERPHIP